MTQNNYLFIKYDLDSVLNNQKNIVVKKIDNFDPKKLTQESLTQTAEELYDEAIINPIQLIEGAISASTEEVDIDVSQEQQRYIRDRSQPFYIKGIKVNYYVPFSGDKELFYVRPNTFSLNPPQAIINTNELIITTTIQGTDVISTKSYFDSQLSSIKKYLDWQKGPIETFNNALDSFINARLTSRLNHIQATQKSINELGIPIRNQQIPPSTSFAQKSQSAKKTVSLKKSDELYDVALSFAGENRLYVEKCAELLKTNSIKVFYDAFEKASLWGKNLIDHLADIYGNKSRYVVMFISEHYVKKAWPTHERQHAQSRALMADDSYILPVRFDDTEVPGLPSTVSYIDLRSTSPKELVNLIIHKLKS